MNSGSAGGVTFHPRVPGGFQFRHKLNVPNTIHRYFELRMDEFETRTQICNRTGIPKGAITRLLQFWLERDMVDEGPYMRDDQGRYRQTFRRRFNTIAFREDGTVEVAI